MTASIGSKIKALRGKLEICQEGLCCEILSQTILSKIENDKMIPSIPQLKHIAGSLGVPISYFFDESEPQCRVNIVMENTSNEAKLYEQKKYEDVIDLYETGGLQDLDRVDTNFYVGMSYFFNGLYNDSLKILRRFITRYKKLDDIQKESLVEKYAEALNKLSTIMHQNSNYDKGIRYLYRAKSELERQLMTESRIYYIIVHNIGSVYYESYKFAEIVSTMEKFLKLNKDVTYLSILPHIHLLLNVAYFRLNDYIKASENIKQAIWLHRYAGQLSNAEECYVNYINCLRFQYKLDEALCLVEKLIDEYSGDKEVLNLLRIQKMIVLFNMDRFEDSLMHAKRLKIEELRQRSRMEYYYMLGHMEFLNKEYAKALNHLKRCEKYFINNRFYPDLGLLYEDMYRITGEIGYKDNSLRYRQLDGVNNILLTKRMP